jgi:hypothetical protein
MADFEITVRFIDGSAIPQNQLSVSDGEGGVAPQTALRANGSLVSDANPLPSHAPPCTPAAGTAWTIATGGTAIIAITGPVRTGYITNPESNLDQGIEATEQGYVDMVNTPGSAPGSGNGTATSLDPGQTWSLPHPIPAGVTVKVNAATAGHKFTVVTGS